MDVSVGDIVYSVAGRDKGVYFVVMKVIQNYVLICDGKSRKTDKPKKKKIKHIKIGFGHSEHIASKLANDEKITNAELRRELDPYTDY